MKKEQPVKKNKLHRFFLILAIALALLAAFALWQNNGLMTTEYRYVSPLVTAELNGCRIAVVSDLHNKDFHGRLAQATAAAAPDLIVLTGDLIDCRHPDIATALAYVEQAADIAPIYFVPGNHESNAGHYYQELRQGLLALGVTLLENSSVTISYHGGSFRLWGLMDQAFGPPGEDFLPDEPGLDVLLAHRPEYFPGYAAQGADLTLSGHAHGGQWRLPGIGGLIAPGQGFFPRYDGGMYQEGEHVMVLSRGLGNSVVKLRLFNRPELVMVTLASPEQPAA